MAVGTAAGERLNLGCGAFKKPGFLNVDVDPRHSPDVRLDLDQLPYPFADGRFELVEADHVLEHLRDPFAVMAELHRILDRGGRLVIRVPHFSRGFTHPDHKRGFDVSFPLYFDATCKPFFSGTPLVLESMRLHWSAQPYLKRQVLSPALSESTRILGVIFDFLANLAPRVCSRGWCFWVGGFEEIEFRFRKP